MTRQIFIPLWLLASILERTLAGITATVPVAEVGDAPKIFDGEIVTDPNEISAFAVQCFNDAFDCGGCGGTLITPTHVLTAAHCMFGGVGVEDFPTHVRVGGLSSTGGERIAVESVSVHPDYDANNIFAGSDIAVIFLATEASEPPRTFNRDIGFPSGTEEVAVTAYGYGGIDEAGNLSDDLRKAALTLQLDAFCEDGFGDFLADSQVCTTNPEEGICGGDSGGPIIDNDSGVILGMLSYGSAFCGPGTEDVWTDPAAFVEWIDEQTGDATVAPTTGDTAAPTTAPSEATGAPTIGDVTDSPTIFPTPPVTSFPTPVEDTCGVDRRRLGSNKFPAYANHHRTIYHTEHVTYG